VWPGAARRPQTGVWVVESVISRLFVVDRSRARLPVALVAAVVVAQTAVFLMRPREGVVDPAPVSVRSYFSDQQLERARDFRRPQLALGIAAMLVEGGVLVYLIRRPPKALTRAWRRPIVAGALAGAALSATLAVTTLPIGAVAHERAADVGLSTQDWGSWLVDRGRSTAISAVIAGGGAALFLGLVRKVPRHWWAPGSVAVVAIGAAFLYASPLVLDPLFNKFTKLPPGQTRADVLELARKSGVDVGEVYEVDASRRTTAANAYVTGLGHSKRVVLYDNLIKDFSRDETRLVVAHELGHVHYKDVPRGLIFLLLVAPAGMFAVQRLTERLTPERGTAGMLPALALSIGIVSFGVTVISNQLSRRVEARADTYSLRLTGEPEPFIGMERRLAVKNISDPDPPGVQTFLFGTHPPTIERIGAGVAWQRGER
jgi:STE24 endopeptidase